MDLSAWLLTAYLAGASADVATTCVAFNQGLVEGNPVYGSGAGCGRVALIKGATTGTIVWFVEKKFKTRKSKIVAYALLGSISAIPVAHNLRAINRTKR